MALRDPHWLPYLSFQIKTFLAVVLHAKLKISSWHQEGSMSEHSLRTGLKKDHQRQREGRADIIFYEHFLLPMWEQRVPQLPTMQCQEGERPQAVSREIPHREQAEGLSRLGMVGGRNAILVPEVFGADIIKGISKKHRAASPREPSKVHGRP